MQRSTKNKLKKYSALILWILLIQLILVNISAAIYAYKFTHFSSNPPAAAPSKNFFTKTWKLFTGPDIYKFPLKAVPSFSYQPVSFPATKGITINGWYSTADSAKGCVIFFHGYTANKGMLINEAEQFRSWGYNVLLIDFRAHGNSSGNKTSFGVKETEEVEKAFKFAQSKGNSKILLYGVSLGSVVIMKAVAENKVRPIGIVADMPFGSLEHHLEARARIIGFPSQPFAFLVTMWTGIENGYNGFGHDTYAYAKKVGCPVLLQWGEVDPFVTRKEMEEVFSSVNSKEKKLVIYPNASHESLLNNNPGYWDKNVRLFTEAVMK